MVDEIVTNLSDVYDEIYADPEPSIVTLRTVAHLGTHISARHPPLERAPDALEVLRMLHPTAAVGGIPREGAYDLIAVSSSTTAASSPDPVGLDGRQRRRRVVDRPARRALSSGATFEAWAGAGIVSESDPIAEREETRAKLAVVLSSLLVRERLALDRVAHSTRRDAEPPLGRPLSSPAPAPRRRWLGTSWTRRARGP